MQTEGFDIKGPRDRMRKERKGGENDQGKRVQNCTVNAQLIEPLLRSGTSMEKRGIVNRLSFPSGFRGPPWIFHVKPRGHPQSAQRLHDLRRNPNVFYRFKWVFRGFLQVHPLVINDFREIPLRSSKVLQGLQRSSKLLRKVTRDLPRGFHCLLWELHGVSSLFAGYPWFSTTTSVVFRGSSVVSHVVHPLPSQRLFVYSSS